MKSIEQLAFEYWCDLDPREELELWLQIERQQGIALIDLELHHLYQQHQQVIKYAVLRVAFDRSGFLPVSKEGERFARMVLMQEGLKLIAGEIKPIQFCKLIHLFDTNFTGIDSLEGGEISYPLWLGDLWNCCERSDYTATIEELPELSGEVKRIIERYEEEA